jgi:hypothetical protein
MTKSAGYSEVDAMRDVDEALNKLDAEAQHRVLGWAASKYSISQKSSLTTVLSAPGLSAPPMQPARNIKEFLTQKRPDNSYERVACLVYHLEKFGGKNEVDTKEIVQANADARLQKMSNPAVFIKHATHTYGYLSSLGGRKFAISARGEAVVEALPDRLKVDEVHSNLPFGRKSKKRSRRNK